MNDPSPVPDGLPLLPGTRGEEIRDLQQRLTAVGVDLVPAEPGWFGPATDDAVRRFQERRGLLVTGACDRATWQALVEAGYRLGDRLLYLRRPMLRGDDVADLQLRLGTLGFDAGRVDGIFGPLTEQALTDFQRNAALTTDGVAGPDVLAVLDRFGARGEGASSVAGVREREALRNAPRRMHDRRVVVGESGGLDALATAVGRLLHDAGAVVAVLHHPDPSIQAAEANAFGAEVYLGLAVAGEPRCRAAFYATEGFESAGGRRLADCVVEALDRRATLPVQRAQGMRLPILRETRMPAVMCYLGPVDQVVTRSGTLAEVIVGSIGTWVEAPVETA